MSKHTTSSRFSFSSRKLSILGIALVFCGVLVLVVLTLFNREGSAPNLSGHSEGEHDHEHGHEHDHSPAVSDPQVPPRKLHHVWLETHGNDQDVPTRPEGMPDDSVYLTLTGEYDQWLLGTPVEISIPQTDKAYRSIVDRIVPDEFGNTSIYAKPEQDTGEFQRLIVTYGTSQTYAYVSTSDGSYEFHGTDESGWLTPTSSLGSHIDYSKPDVLETRRDRHADTKYVPPREE